MTKHASLPIKRLLELLEKNLQTKHHSVVFICGHGGAGKTTFAHTIERLLPSVVLELDWFLTHPSLERRRKIARALASNNAAAIEREENPQNWYDWNAFAKAVRTFQTKGSLSLRNAWNQKNGKKDIHIHLRYQKGKNCLLLCEGIYLLHPPIRALADVVVLLRHPLISGRKRAERRDAHRSDPAYLAWKATLLKKYDIPYFKKYQEKATIKLRTMK